MNQLRKNMARSSDSLIYASWLMRDAGPGKNHVPKAGRLCGNAGEDRIERLPGGFACRACVCADLHALRQLMDLLGSTERGNV